LTTAVLEKSRMQQRA